MNILFFGSSSDSLIVLKRLSMVHGPSAEGKLSSTFQVVAVVTQPARPVGRKQILTPTPTETWAKEHSIPVLTFSSDPKQPQRYADENAAISALESFHADVIVCASYGQWIPTKILADAIHGGINVHPSLLPRWRGAQPVPWAILSGDHQVGVTIVTLNENFDEGKIIAQKKIPLTDADQNVPVREQLFTLGAELLTEILPSYINGSLEGILQDQKQSTWAGRFTREDGFIPWELIQLAMNGEPILMEKIPSFFQEVVKHDLLGIDHWSLVIERATRALSPWPGVWTLQKDEGKGTEVRMKILSAHIEHHDEKDKLVLDQIQLEGKNPVQFSTLRSV